MDFDYIAKLSPEELEFLNKFSDEYYNNHFRRDGTDLHDDEQRRACYRTDYRRQQDQWNKLKRMPNDYTAYIADETPPSIDEKSALEDSLAEVIDGKKL